MQAGDVPVSVPAPKPGHSASVSTNSRPQVHASKNIYSSPHKRPKLVEDDIDWGTISAQNHPAGGTRAMRPPGSQIGPRAARHGASPANQSQQFFSPSALQSALERLKRPPGSALAQAAKPGAASGFRAPHGAHDPVEADIEWDSLPPKRAPKTRPAAIAEHPAIPCASVILRGQHATIPSKQPALVEAEIDWELETDSRQSSSQARLGDGHARKHGSPLAHGSCAPSKDLLLNSGRHTTELSKAHRSDDLEALRMQQALGHTAGPSGKARMQLEQEHQDPKGPSGLVKRQMETIHRLKIADSRQTPNAAKPKTHAHAHAKPALVPQEADIEW